jgi:DNA (cytosine-5)-methyltransferase 1
MVNYSCEKCGKTFKQKGHYMKHLQRKTPCDNIKDKIENIVEKKVDELMKEKLQDLVEKGDIEIKNKNLISNNQNSNIDNTAMEDKKIKILSLFSGCGGLDYGFEKSDIFEIVKAYDFNKDAVETYNHNFEYNKSECVDIKKIDTMGIVDIDMIIGGPPCQDFSVAGKKNLGERSSMTNEFIDIICNIKPKYFIMENVPAIKSIGKDVYMNIISKLKENKYGLTENIVNMSDYGVPSLRKRLIIIGILNEKDNILQEYFEFHKEKCSSLNDYLIKHNITLDSTQKHIYRHPCNYSRRGVFSFDELYPTIRGCMRRMPPKYKFHDNDTHKIREEILNPTIDIISMIQTFPKDFKFIEKKNNQLLIGNSVPPLMSIKLRNILISYINK